MRTIKYIIFTALLTAASSHSAVAQEQPVSAVSPCKETAGDVWTVEDCMRYAVLHSHTVAVKRLELSNNKATRMSAVGAFLPSINAGIGAQENFGRAIDPETNTYTDVSTFYNSYSVSASLPVFDGFSRINQLKASRIGVLLGKTELQIAQDETALSVMQAYADALYYQSAVRFVASKLEQSQSLLRLTRTMEEVGLKSGADIAQVEAQVAADEVELTRQENNYQKAMLELENKMGKSPTTSILDKEGDFTISANSFLTQTTTEEASQGESAGASALLEAERLRVSQAERSLAIAGSWFMPSISLQGGISTMYYKTIGRKATPFSEQWRNNAGQYIGVSLSVPIFNRLASLSNFRKQKNNLMIANERMADRENELTRLRLQTEAECTGLAKEVTQMQHKVAADSLSLALTTRQYEQGIASPLDVQSTATTLLQSRAALLKTQLMLAIKQRQRDYYNGRSLTEEML